MQQSNQIRLNLQENVTMYKSLCKCKQDSRLQQKCAKQNTPLARLIPSPSLPFSCNFKQRHRQWSCKDDDTLRLGSHIISLNLHSIGVQGCESTLETGQVLCRQQVRAFPLCKTQQGVPSVRTPYVKHKLCKGPQCKTQQGIPSLQKRFPGYRRYVCNPRDVRDAVGPFGQQLVAQIGDCGSNI